MKKKLVAVLSAVLLVACALACFACARVDAGKMDRLVGTYQLTKYRRVYSEREDNGEKAGEEEEILTMRNMSVYLVIDGTEYATVVYRDNETELSCRQVRIEYNYDEDDNRLPTDKISTVSLSYPSSDGKDMSQCLSRASLGFVQRSSSLNFSIPNWAGSVLQGTWHIESTDHVELKKKSKAKDLSYVEKQLGVKLEVTPYKTEPEPEESVSYEVPTDGSLPTEHTALENFGYLNSRFRAQTNWYSETHGTLSTSVSSQTLHAYKQFSGGKLISTTVFTSDAVKLSRQLCETESEVLWRLGSTYTGATYEEMQAITWNDGEPYGHESAEDFRRQNGFPESEMSAYVVNENTLNVAGSVEDNGDGTYSQKYYLNIITATSEYAKQLMFTQGYTEYPMFRGIQVTYTFDAQWNLRSSSVTEEYEATADVAVTITAQYTTTYEYGTDKANSAAFDGYFKQHLWN